MQIDWFSFTPIPSLLGGMILGVAAALFVLLHGRNPAKLLNAKSREDQQRIFEEELAPLFEMRHRNKPLSK